MNRKVPDQKGSGLDYARNVDRDCREADANLLSKGIVLPPNQRGRR